MLSRSEPENVKRGGRLRFTNDDVQDALTDSNRRKYT